MMNVHILRTPTQEFYQEETGESQLRQLILINQLQQTNEFPSTKLNAQLTARRPSIL